MSIPSASAVGKAVVMTAISLAILKLAAPMLPASVRSSIGI